MKHLLLLTYGFPPANNMAAQRCFLRAKGLTELGYRVSVVTRPWSSSQGIGSVTERASNQIVREPFINDSAVYRVPFGISALLKLNLLQKKLMLADGGIARNMRYFFCPLESEIRLGFDFSKLGAMLDGVPDVVMASGAPWSGFELGRDLARYFGAKYVAEYRDAWGYLDERFKVEGNNSYNDNVFSQLKRRYALRLERKLNSGADLVVAVSQPILENALKITGVHEGIVIHNGFDPAEIRAAPVEKWSKFTLSYIGTIYNTQRADTFFKALEVFIDRHSIPLDQIQVKLVGSSDSHGFARTSESIRACRHHEKVVEVTSRADKKTSLMAQKSSAMLLYFAHDRRIAGVYSGKIFEYIASGTPILFAPSDHGVVAELIRETQTGTVCDSIEETVACLKTAFETWQKTGKVSHSPNFEAVDRYSYLALNRRLADRIEGLSNHLRE